MASKVSRISRCPWCGEDPLYQRYHDTEWGVPLFDSKDLFAKLILDGAQAGLSWITILRRRDGYYQAADNLDPEILAHYSDHRLEELLQDSRLIRNRLKIASLRKNAQAWLTITQSDGPQAFSQLLWDAVEGKPLQNAWPSMDKVPTQTEAAQKLSKTLKKMGFTFVGPTIIYAFMQATGMVNDHLTSCFRWKEVQS